DGMDCRGCADRTLVCDVVMNIFLMILKFLGGFLAGSAGLIADGIESFSCLIASIAVMFSSKIAQRGRDRKFPFGYEKIEFLVAMVVFSGLIGVGVFITLSSLVLIIKGDESVPGIWALPIAVVSVFLTYVMYKYNLCAGKKMDSPGIIANAYQCRADMLTSTAVAFGIILAQITPGFAFFDRLAALFVGCLIIKESLGHWIINLNVILEKIPQIDFRERIRSVIAEVFLGHRPKLIKIKRTGKNFWVGIGLDFPDTISIEEMEKTSGRIRTRIQEKIPWAGEVVFFLDR
ncbi:cation transporter, partial [PVC group bacterium]|nr:cation transporter [PVC group bacterium]